MTVGRVPSLFPYAFNMPFFTAGVPSALKSVHEAVLLEKNSG